MHTRLSPQSLLTALCSLALLFSLSACDGDDGPGAPPPTEVNTAQYISSRSDLNELNAALQAAELTSTLEGDGPFTVFAPTNAALADLNVDGLTADNVDLLTKILTYHVVPGEAIMAGSISDGQSVTTVEGTDITFTVSDGNVQLGIDGMTATVQTTDLETTNGVIHIIDAVLFGPTNIVERAQATPSTETLASVLPEDIASTLSGDGPFTVFAPVNSAFSAIDADDLTADADLLDEVLNYHVLPGETLSGDISDGQTVETAGDGSLTFGVSDGTVTVNGKTVTTADIQTQNGVIHLIDGVLLETLDVTSYASVVSETEALASAVTDAGLANTLATGGPFTVFAPVNSAFAALDANDDGTVNGDELDGDLRTRVLQYHVVSGEEIPLIGAGLSDDATRATLDAGQNLTFSIDTDADSITAVNGAEIAGTVEVENGTIHLLNEVLLQSTNVVQRASLDPNLTALVDAVNTAGLAGALSDENATFTVFAPPNSAFSGLDTDAFTGGEDSKETLAGNIVGYHAIQGSALAAEDIMDGSTPGTVEGNPVTLRTFADGSVTVNGISVTTADIQVRNGIIHLIDGVLLEGLNIAQRATVEPSLSTLVTAVDEAGLTNTLATGGPFTVFAPTNDAFVAALDENDDGTVGGDELPNNLADILQYHVLNGTTLAGDITNGGSATTLEGSDVGFAVGTDGSVTVNPDDEGASVTVADIEVENGVIHIVDTVLLPGDQSSN